MTVPLVAAFSASCSRKLTEAPRPATSAGSSAARVTTGAVPALAGPAMPITPRPRAATDATASKRDGVRDIKDSFLWRGREMGTLTLEPSMSIAQASVYDLQ